MHKRASRALAEAVAQLRSELRRVERRIDALRAMQSVHAGATEASARQRRTDGWTDEKRQEVSERMRAYWAARRATAPAALVGQAVGSGTGQEPEDGVEGFRKSRRQWPETARAEASRRMQERWRARRDQPTPPAP